MGATPRVLAPDPDRCKRLRHARLCGPTSGAERWAQVIEWVPGPPAAQHLLRGGSNRGDGDPPDKRIGRGTGRCLGPCCMRGAMMHQVACVFMSSGSRGAREAPGPLVRWPGVARLHGRAAISRVDDRQTMRDPARCSARTSICSSIALPVGPGRERARGRHRSAHVPASSTSSPPTTKTSAQVTRAFRGPT